MKKLLILLLVLPLSAMSMGDLFKKKNLNEKQAEQVQKIAIYETELLVHKLLLEHGRESLPPIAPDIDLDNSPGKLVTALNVATNVSGMLGVPGIQPLAELIIGSMGLTGVAGITGLQFYNRKGRKKIEVERDVAKDDAEDKRKMLKVVTDVVAKRPEKEFKEIRTDVKKKMDRKNLNVKFEDAIGI